MSGTGLSVVICCCNSAARIAESLSYLQRQLCPAGLQWEVVLVNNASTDETMEIARQAWDERPVAPMRIVSEQKAGLAYARIAGVREAQYPYVSFIDDDNWVCESWVANVVAFFEQYPGVGAVGGLNSPVFEVEPPDWFGRFQRSYAVGPQAAFVGDITWSHGVLSGAGLSVRVAAWQDLFEKGFLFTLLGRVGRQLLCGEDYELCLALRLAVWEIWYDTELTLQHYIPRERLSWKHLRKMVAGYGFVKYRLAAYGYGSDGGNPVEDDRWAVLFFKTLRKLCRFKAFKLIGSRFLDFEGDPDIIMVDVHIAAMKELLFMKGDYADYRQRIALAEGNRSGGTLSRRTATP